jgi:deoxyribonuclease-4
MIIGAHVSASGGVGKSIKRGADIGAEAIQIFTNNPRSWSQSTGSPVTPEEVSTYLDAREKLPAVKMVFTHVTYLVNIASSDDTIYEKSKIGLAANLAAALGIGATGAVLHPGSHRGSGFDSCRQRIVDGIAWAFDHISERDVVTTNIPLLLLENTAGAGGTVGRSFSELASLIEALDSIGLEDQIGICLDTQHMWASGMQYTTIEYADRLIDDFDKLIGIERLKCLHLNDSKVPYGSQRDRHANIGEGMIGIDGLAFLVGHPSLAGIPAILEVPGNGHGPGGDQVALARETLRIGTAIRESTGNDARSNTGKE